MLNPEIISKRLNEMSQQPDPSNHLWPENCAGSRKAMVIFVGPSPGGTKEKVRREIKTEFIQPLWNEPYTDPLSWSAGFKVSFKSLVESIFAMEYDDAAKLITRMNMDWLQNPESQDVSYRYMWEGCRYILPIIEECNPEIIIPMDEKTFNVLQMFLYNDGYEIIPEQLDKIKVLIAEGKKKKRYHTAFMAFWAKKEGKKFFVIKSLQHPARIFKNDYATRIGEALRSAVKTL